MSKYLQLTKDTATGMSVLVNMGQVSKVEDSSKGGSILFFGDERLAVKESLTQIASQVVGR